MDDAVDRSILAAISRDGRATLAQLQPRPPFAVAVNTEFVPKGQYDSRQLHAGDKLEVISPVTGG